MLRSAWGVSGSKVMHLAKDQPMFDRPGGVRITRMRVAGVVSYLGYSGAWKCVLIGTGIPYGDRKVRPTGLWVPAAAGQITDR